MNSRCAPGCAEEKYTIKNNQASAVVKMSSIIYKSQNNEESEEKLESFCSSCKSALNMIYSLGVPSSLEEFSGKLSKETSNLNASTNHFIVQSNIENSSLMIDEKRRINDEINLPIHKKIKCNYHSKGLSQAERVQSKCLDNEVISQCTKNDTTIQNTKIEEINGNNIRRRIGESEHDSTKTTEINRKTLMLNKNISENNKIADHKELDVTCLQENVTVPMVKQTDLNIDENMFITNSSHVAHLHKSTRKVQNNTINRRKNILRITNQLLNLSHYINVIKDATNMQNGQIQKSDMSNNYPKKMKWA